MNVFRIMRARWKEHQLNHKLRMAVENERERNGLCRECSSNEEVLDTGYCAPCDQVGRL